MQWTNHTLVTEFVLLAFSTANDPHFLLFTVFFLVFMTILLEHLALMMVIIANHSLHILMYYFLWVLSFVELFCLCATIPRLLVSLLTGKNTISFAGCATQMFLFNFIGISGFLVVVVMGYDRYVAVSSALQYKLIMTDGVCVKLIFICFLIGFLWTLPTIYIVFSVPYCESNGIDHFFCDVGQVIILAINCTDLFPIYELILVICGVMSFNLPFVLVMISYIYIVSAILKIRTTDGRRKAFYSCSSHLSTVIIEYSCFVFIYLRPKESFLFDKDRIFVIAFTFVNSFSLPLIYSLRNKAVKSAFRKTISRTKLYCSY